MTDAAQFLKGTFCNFFAHLKRIEREEVRASGKIPCTPKYYLHKLLEPLLARYASLAALENLKLSSEPLNDEDTYNVTVLTEGLLIPNAIEQNNQQLYPQT